MKKRSNENSQIDKFQYNDLEKQSDNDKSSGSFQRLSAEKLQKRRIVSVNKKWKTPAAGILDGKSQPSVSLNSDRSTVSSGRNLFGKQDTSPSPNTPSEKKNPFAKISFAATSTDGAKNNTQQTVGKPPFEFMPKKSSQPSNYTSTESSGKEGNNKTIAKGFKDINIKFLETILTETKNNRSGDLSHIFHNYVAAMKDQNLSVPKKSDEKGSFVLKHSIIPTPSKKSSDKNNFFSFGTPPTSNAASDTSTKKPNNFTSFNFSSTTKKDDKIGNNDENEKENELDETLPEKNEKEEVVFEARSKYLKMTSGKWKGYSSGVLRLYKSKESESSKKIVLRNSSGRVQLNLRIYEGMMFTKTVQKTKGYVGFAAVADEKVGLEKFQLMVQLENLDPLFKSLQELAK